MPYLFFATKKGLVKKTELSEYQNIRNSGLVAIKLDPNDQLLETKTTSGKDLIFLCSSNGKSIEFKEGDVRPTGRASRGVTGMRFKAEDFLVGMEKITPEDKNNTVLVISEHGFGKKTKISEYRLQNRGGSGIFTAKITPKTGRLVKMHIVDPKSHGDLLLISAQGQVIRLSLASVPLSGRQTQGVKLINLDPGDKVASVTTLAEAVPEEEPIQGKTQPDK